MIVEEISISQILTAIIFIAVLIAIQIFIKKNKNTLKNKLSSNQRINLVNTTRLSPTERIQIIQVDKLEYLYFFSKGNQPVIIPLDNQRTERKDSSINVGTQRSPQIKATADLNRIKEKSKGDKARKTPNKIIQAISIARKQNPKVSFE